LVIIRNLALVPLFIGHIGIFEYNAWLASGGVLGQVASLDFGLGGVLQQQAAVAHGRGDRERLATVVGTGLIALLAICGILLLVSAGLAVALPALLHLPAAVGRRLTVAFCLASIGTVLQLAAFGMASVLIGLQRPVGPGISRIASDAVSLVVTVYLVKRGWGLNAIGLGFVCRMILDVGIVGLVFRKIWSREFGLRLRLTLSTAPGLFRLSGSQFLTQLAARAKYSLDPALVGVLLGVDAAGAFALTTRAHEVVRMFVMQVSGALMPALSHLFGEGAIARLRQIGIASFRVTAAVAAVGMGSVVALNESFVRLWVGSEHYAGTAVTVAAAVWGFTGLMAAASYDQMLAIGAYAETARLVWADALLRLPLLLLGLLTVGIVAVPACSLVSQTVTLNWWLTRLLFERLEFPAGARREVTWLNLRHSGIPFVLGATWLAIGVPVRTWGMFALAAMLIGAAAAISSLVVDREMRRIVRGASDR
jgi:O-antigen/teichoic acid export membrane protein